jgi:hypothetical protein
MRATEVRVLHALDTGESYVDPAFLLVETSLDESGDTVTTIEHVTNQVVDGKDRWHIATLGQFVPLTHAAALEWAVSFAASRGIPVVYERNDSVPPNYAATPSTRMGSPTDSSASK